MTASALAGLLPSTVEVEHTTLDVPEDRLLGAEADLIARAVPQRRAEFVAARHCARLALARLGHAPAPLLAGPRREPLWPAGVVGSLTHCEGYRAAAVARPSDVVTLGIDAEVHGPLPDGVVGIVTLPSERTRLADLAAADADVSWERVLFSAKESIYKAWYPLTQAWLDFTECDLTIGVDGTFAGRLLVPGPAVGERPLEVFTGRWTVDGRHVLTACWEPARS